MQRRVSKYTSALVTLAVVTAWAAGTVVGRAATPADDVFIRQAGNGAGASEPVIPNFSIGTVLFDNTRFQGCQGSNCLQRPTSKYVAWGTMTVTAGDQSVERLAMVTGGDDGISWGAPTPATLQSPRGETAPFVMASNGGYFDVIFTNAADQPFRIYYRPPGTDLTKVASIHAASSLDGVNWFADSSITQDETSPETQLVTGGGPSFKAQTYGPSDVIFQASGSSTCTTGTIALNFPWNCKYVMLYDATGSVQATAAAGSGDGLAFRGLAAAILSPGPAGSWDEQSATLTHARVLAPGKVELYYSGGKFPTNACMDGHAGCFSIGTAYGDGLVFTKNASNPVTPSTLIDAFSPDAPTSIWNPQVVDAGTTPSKVYFTRITNKRQADVFLGYTAKAPSQSPDIAISSPSAAYGTAETIPVVAFMSDTLGSGATKIGLDLSTVAISLDGQPFGGFELEDSIVTAYNRPATKVTIRGNQVHAETGLHTLSLQVADLDGNITKVTRRFEIDGTAPVTQMTGKPASPQVGFPDSIGTFSGTTVEGTQDTGTSIVRLRAIVVDPLGQVKTYETPRATGFPTDKVTAKTWNWSFVAPALDPFFLVPGNYKVSVIGIDAAGNVERVTAANTATVLVL